MMRAEVDPNLKAALVAAEPPSKLTRRENSRDEAASFSLLDGAALAAPLPALDYLVKEIGLVAGSGAPHLVAGYGFTGKTIALQALALSLASGRNVWGAFRADQRRVLHLDYEQGERLTRRRYQRLARGMGLELATLDAIAVAIMPALPLSPSDEWRRLMSGRDLVIIDSLRAASGAADENDSTIRGGIDFLGRVSEETGCRAIVIHHARKPSGEDPGARFSIRGSSAIFDAVDSAYVFSADKGEPVGVTHTKARTHGEPVADFALVIADVEHDGDPRGGLSVRAHGGELVTQRREARIAEGKRDRARRDGDAVRTALSSQPGLGTSALRDATSLSGDRLRAALTVLAADIERREEGTGRTKTMRHYLRSAS